MPDMKSFGGWRDPSKMKVEQLSAVYDFYSESVDGPSLVWNVKPYVKHSSPPADGDDTSLEGDDDDDGADGQGAQEGDIRNASSVGDETSVARALQEDEEEDEDDEQHAPAVPSGLKVVLPDDNGNLATPEEDGASRGDRDLFPCTSRQSSDAKRKFLTDKLVDFPEFLDLVRAYLNTSILKVCVLVLNLEFC
jgi:hypothetical protein